VLSYYLNPRKQHEVISPKKENNKGILLLIKLERVAFTGKDWLCSWN